MLSGLSKLLCGEKRAVSSYFWNKLGMVLEVLDYKLTFFKSREKVKVIKL